MKIKDKIMHIIMCLVPLTVFLVFSIINFKIIYDDTSINHWIWLFTIIVSIFITELYELFFPDHPGKLIRTGSCILRIFLYTGLVYYSVFFMDRMFPSFSKLSIENSEQQIYFTLALVILPVFYHLLQLIFRFTGNISRRNLFKNIAYAVLVLIAAVLVFYFVNSSRPGTDESETILLILSFIFLILFFFFSLKVMYIFIKIKKNLLHNPVIIFLFALIFPLTGLVINNLNGFVFGDFSDLWFYLIPFFTASTLFLSRVKNKTVRIINLAAKAVLLCYSFYFALVFLPVLPIAPLLIIIFGAGFLLLTPAVLLYIHLASIIADINLPGTRINKKILIISSIILSAAIPVILVINMYSSRETLNTALEISAAPISRTEDTPFVNVRQLSSVLELAENNRSGNGFDIFQNNSGNIPIISGLSRKIILNDYLLNPESIRRLKKLFLNIDMDARQSTLSLNKESFNLKIIAQSTVRDTDLSIYRTWIHFSVQTKEDEWEYRTMFRIPEDIYIHDFYLDIEGKREYGILEEKETSSWLYRNLVRRMIDPAFLRYVSLDRIALDIFPFEKNKPRYFGIEFIHSKDFNIEFDDLILTPEFDAAEQLQENTVKTIISENSSFTAIADFQTDSGMPVYRKPMFYFLLDYSSAAAEEMNSHIEKYTVLISGFIEKFGLEGGSYKIAAANYSFQLWDSFDEWQMGTASFKPAGGFDPELLLSGLLLDIGQNISLEYYPVFIISGEHIPAEYFHDNLRYLRHIIPEGLFIGNDEKIFRYDLSNAENNDKPLETDVFRQRFPVFRIDSANRYYVNETENFFLQINNINGIFEENSFNNYDRGSLLNLKILNYLTAVQKNYSSNHWLRNVEYSFRIHVLTPYTSFISLETESQKKLLLAKQEEFLNEISNGPKMKSGSDSIKMSEPGLLFLILIILSFTAVLLIKRKAS